MNRFLPLLFLLVMPLAQAAAPANGGTSKLQFNLPVDARCKLSLGSHVIDYGTMSRGQLQDTTQGRNTLTPGKRTMILSAVCPYSQSMRFALRGDRSATGNLRYGDQGSMTVRISEAQLDGQSVQVVSTSLEGIVSGAASDTRLLQPGQIFAPIANGRLAKGKAFTARLEIEPVLPEAETRVSARQSSEATLTLELMN
ncbi:fimbrial protein [Pseudomonas sp. O64]|uniref:fimbrial protein n=1 Tax=unclassified Pseudomonas TaxID=196821 RepID=UPI0021D803E8|nr:fimbrial protein [Pseudomonas sp. YeP6b]UXZ19940.1 fimbrial protein [Pseudomonas sp. YeP6b]